MVHQNVATTVTLKTHTFVASYRLIASASAARRALCFPAMLNFRVRVTFAVLTRFALAVALRRFIFRASLTLFEFPIVNVGRFKRHSRKVQAVMAIQVFMFSESVIMSYK